VNGIATWVFAVFAASSAFADPILPGPVAADLVRVIDGDTFEADVYPWPALYVRVSVRVRGLDTPEVRGKCPEERALAAQATKRTEALLRNGFSLCHIEPRDKYGRTLANVALGADCSAADLAQTLITEGLGRHYDGGTRQSWCEGVSR
jgi:endonuclease YncB( thermonuclease family)